MLIFRGLSYIELTLINTFTHRVKNWWLSLLIGILAIILGIWCAAAIPETLIALSMLFVAGFVVSGISSIVFSLCNKKELKGWGWSLTSGIIDLMIALVLMSMPISTILILVLYVGFWIMFQSIWGLGAARQLQKIGIKGSGWLIFLSVLGIILSFILIFNPTFASGFLVMLSSISFICYGILRVYYAFRLKQIGKEIEDMLD